MLLTSILEHVMLYGTAQYSIYNLPFVSSEMFHNNNYGFTQIYMYFVTESVIIVIDNLHTQLYPCKRAWGKG